MGSSTQHVGMFVHVLFLLSLVGRAFDFRDLLELFFNRCMIRGLSHMWLQKRLKIRIKNTNGVCIIFNIYVESASTYHIKTAHDTVMYIGCTAK